MSDRGFRRAWWGIVAGVAAALTLLASCSGDLDGPDAASTVPSSPTSTGASNVSSSPVSAGPDSVPVDSSIAATAFVPPADNPDELAAWHQVEARDGQLVLNAGVTPYTLNTPLFSDYAHKLRTIWIPEGADPAAYDPMGSFDFPVGTVVTKTFYYPEPAVGTAPDGAVLGSPQRPSISESLDLDEVRLIETRVLVRREDGWHGLPYVWNEDETLATLQRTGDIVPLSLVDDEGERSLTYVVPDVNQCASCHATDHSTGAIELIGVQARHVNLDLEVGGALESQIDRWQELGLLIGVPSADEIPKAAVWDDDTASLEDRARAYLDINCAHCHNPVGAADTSGLFLDQTTEIGPAFGVCKPPVAAGGGTGDRPVDIYPGDPDQSVMVYRMDSTEPDAMMPELGRSTTHTEGVDVIAQWIESLEGSC